MTDFVRVLDFSNKFSSNVMPKTSILEDGTPYNVTSGTGTLAFEQNAEYGNFVNVTCQSYKTTDLTFNFNDKLATPVIDGNYLFQMSIYDIDTSADFFPAFEFGVNVYKDGVFDETIMGQFVTDVSLNSKKTITFSQNILCNSVAELDFTFTIFADLSYPFNTTIFKIGNFKLEHDNKFLGLPTPYSLPIDYYTNPYTGWAYYVDSLATPTISIGTSFTQITIDALGDNIIDYLPKEIRSSAQLFSANKITPVSIGDDYDGRFDCTITAKTGTPNAIEFIIDISGGTAGTNRAFTGWIQEIGTAPYNQSMPLDFFTLTTFLTNGGKLYARVDSGTVSIGRRNIKVSRKSKAF